MKGWVSTMCAVLMAMVVGYFGTLKAYPVVQRFLAPAASEIGDYSAYGVSDTQPVVIYTVEWCGYCEKLKRYLNKNSIRYIEKDIEKSEHADAEFKALDGKGTPLVLISSTLIRGYNSVLINVELEKLSLL